MTAWLTVQRGEAPLLLSLPHTGTVIPAEIERQLVSPALALEDTDWHVERLYAFAAGLGATLLRTAISRSVIDVNRDPSGRSLYPGMTTTDLVPLTTFAGAPLYPQGGEPDAPEVAARREGWFAPYHAALNDELTRLRARHPVVILYDCHSIRSAVPRLFPGELPALNLGTNGGLSCAPALRERLAASCAASGLSLAVDGRFKGGWITRHYGRPEAGVHAVQMELAQRAYMDEAAGAWDEGRAAALRPVLRGLLAAALAWAGGDRG